MIDNMGDEEDELMIKEYDSEQAAVVLSEYNREERAVDRIKQTITDLKALRTFVANELQAGIDYGEIPGTTDKKVLLLPGGQKVAMYFNLRPQYRVTRTELAIGHLEVYVETDMIDRISGGIIGQGVGSCSTMETKYRYRKMERICPECGKAAITKGKQFKPMDPPTWFCWKKKDGCGRVFRIDDPEIVNQEVGKKENENINDERNTCLKMAKKRSYLDAVVGVGCLSELFTVDLEDFYDLEEPKDKEDKPDKQKPEPPMTKLDEIPTVEFIGAAKAMLRDFLDDGLKCVDYRSLLKRFHYDYAAAKRTGVFDQYLEDKRTLFETLRTKINAETLIPIPTYDSAWHLEFYALDQVYRQGNREEANRVFFECIDSLSQVGLKEEWSQFAKDLKREVTGQ